MVTPVLPVQMHNVTVRKRGKTLLGPIDLTVGQTGFTILLGPNGAGKTTLLKALHGLERLNEGRITWSAPDELARTLQAYVFQNPVMLRRSVRANLGYPLKILGRNKQEVDRAVSIWAGRIGLVDALDRPATRLSGGEKQKLALARALIREPEILFLDEPCSNLDGRSIKEIEMLLQTAHQSGTRLIMATHDMGQARRLATEILFLFKGRIHEAGAAPAAFDAPKTPEFKSFLNGDILE
jgi:tungstate transport system ATP-binding protein